MGLIFSHLGSQNRPEQPRAAQTQPKHNPKQPRAAQSSAKIAQTQRRAAGPRVLGPQPVSFQLFSLKSLGLAEEISLRGLPDTVFYVVSRKQLLQNIVKYTVRAASEPELGCQIEGLRLEAQFKHFRRNHLVWPSKSRSRASQTLYFT